MKFEKLVDVLKADSEEGIVDAAVDKINALNDSVAEISKERDALKAKLADEGEDPPADDKSKEGEKPKEGEDKDKPKEGEGEDKDKGKEGTEEAEDAKALKEKLEKVEKENEEPKKEKEAQTDAVKKLTDTEETISKRNAI